MDNLPDNLKTPLAELLLSVADDKFMLGHRNADWTGLAPILEEDIAFSSLAQDDLAHAMALYEFIAEHNLLPNPDREGGAATGDAPPSRSGFGAPYETSQDANRIAYGRKPQQYRCCELVELHDEFDWAVAIVRQFLCDHFEQLRLTRLAASAFTPLKNLAGRILAEERLAIGHADQWIVRLGKAGDDSRKRMQSALDRLAPLASGLFEPPAGLAMLESAGVYPAVGSDIFQTWADAVNNVIEEATLSANFAHLAPNFAGGRQGRHSAAFATLHDEMTEVYRVEPGGKW